MHHTYRVVQHCDAFDETHATAGYSYAWRGATRTFPARTKECQGVKPTQCSCLSDQITVPTEASAHKKVAGTSIEKRKRKRQQSPSISRKESAAASLPERMLPIPSTPDRWP